MPVTVVVIVCRVSRHPFLVLFGHSPFPTYLLGDSHSIPVPNLTSVVACNIMYQLYL